MELLLDLLVTLVGLSVVGQYAVTLRTHFSSDPVPRGTILISLVVTATAALFLFLLWLETQPWLAQVVGVLMEILGIWLFWAAIRASRFAALHMAFDADVPRALVTDGPYRYLRHPFYTSYLIFWVGWAIATWSGWSLLPLLAIGGIYVVAARGEERKFAITPMAADYAAYRRRTGFFWPRWSAVARRG